MRAGLQGDDGLVDAGAGLAGDEVRGGLVPAALPGVGLLDPAGQARLHRRDDRFHPRHPPELTRRGGPVEQTRLVVARPLLQGGAQVARLGVHAVTMTGGCDSHPATVRKAVAIRSDVTRAFQPRCRDRTIRSATPGDRDAVLAVVRDAFSTDDQDGHEELEIVRETWERGAAAEELELVAVEDGAVLGHVLGAARGSRRA